MFLLTTRALALALQIAGGDLTGRVRTSDDGAPLANARIELPDVGRSTRTDRDGRYLIRGIGAGAHELRITRPGYRSRDMRITLSGNDTLQIDIALEPLPTTLVRVTVVGTDDSLPLARTPVVSHEPAVRSLGGRQLHASPTIGEPDVFALLSTAPGVTFDGQRAPSMFVHGGESDQNLALLDGAPVYSPMHFAGLSGAFNPDALSSVDLHAGVPSAEWGDALSSVLVARSRRPDTASVRARGALGAAASRAMIDGPLPFGSAGFLLSGRRSYPSLLTPPQDDSHVLGGSDDVFGKVRTGGSWGDAELMVFHSASTLRFPALANQLAASPPDATGDEPAIVRHRFGWFSDTYALRWERAIGPRARVTSQIWHARSDARATWLASGDGLHMRSMRSGDGIRAELATRVPVGVLTAGVSAERRRVRYGVADSARLEFGAASAPSLASAFVEHHLATARWETNLGMRASVLAGEPLALEPRVSVSYQLSPRVWLEGGAARVYQSMQSLRNSASLVGALFSADLPVAVGTLGVPMARSDQAVLGIDVRPDRRTRLALEGYARRMRGLVLMPLATAQPFAIDDVITGSGRAWGLGLSGTREDERLSVDVSYGIEGSTRRAANGSSYQTGFTARQSLLASVVLRTSRHLDLTAALRAHGGVRSPVVDGVFDWEACDVVDAGCEMAGTPQRNRGPLDAERLPAYVRIDVGARRSWRVRFRNGAGVLGTYLSVGNVLGRANTWALTSQPGSLDGIARVASRQRPVLSLGLDWSL